ncbi:transporter [Paraphotobacterium marinum]|uniref:Transporter n=1 Tax=Paraphotobacterium marinum TaxID=1755811 RepID=A0A220VCM0_9GAMM|nr:efflux RND transporter permease subunit [Paraphotobacterium marinum]ASK78089.1 transporter [Paraphotobacterium marinum]
MKFTDLFISRPVLAVSLSLLVFILGFQALFKMPIQEFPETSNTTITVTTAYAGASPDVIQGFVTQPLEQAIAQVDNIDYITGSSVSGTSTITAYMKLDTDPDAALAQVLSKINSVKASLPSGVQDSNINVTTGSSVGALYLGFSSKTLSSPQLYDYIDRVITPELNTVSGINEVKIYGTQFAMRIWLDPDKMAALNISTDEVKQVLTSNNSIQGLGQVNGYSITANVVANTQYTTPSTLENLVVKSDNGNIVRLKDIATVSLGSYQNTILSSINGKTGLIVAINLAPGANPITVVKGIRDLIPSMEKSMPSAIKMQVLYDQSIFIKEAINDVIKTLIEAVIIVLVVILLFIGSLRALIIPLVTIPLSIVGVSFIMDSLGFSLNLLTLLAMVLAIGLVVDDAIVVLENVERHIAEGKTPFQASIIGTREIAVPVISMTITLAAVYAPIALTGGLSGALFKEFALTLAGSVFISGFVALTLSPMMCSKILKVEPKLQNQNKSFKQKIEHRIEKITNKYVQGLDYVLDNRKVVVTFALLILISMPILFVDIKSEIAPPEDQGVIVNTGTAPTNSNIDYISQNAKITGKLAKENPSVSTSLEIAGYPAANQFLNLVMLKPWDERTTKAESIDGIIAKLTPQIKEIPGAQVQGPSNIPPLPMMNGYAGVYQYIIKTSNSPENLVNVAQKAVEKVLKSKKFFMVNLDLKFNTGEVSINIDKEKAGSYGVTISDIANTLNTMMSGNYINQVNISGRPYYVVPQTLRKNRISQESLKHYYVKSNNGDMIPLSALVTIKTSPSLLTIPTMDQFNSATITAVNPIMTTGEAVSYFKNNIDTMLPTGYTSDWQGVARTFVQEGNSLVFTFILAIFIIYLVLAIQFESVRDPLVIMTSVPLAISGALVVMAWHVTTMNLYSQIGLITLVGLITKHGILICEVAKEEQLHHGKNKFEAVREAARIRFRPILMTTLAMVAGLIPLVLASGAGAAMRFTIGIVIVAGLGIGTLFTLFVLPVIYTYIAQTHKPEKSVEELLSTKPSQD